MGEEEAEKPFLGRWINLIEIFSARYLTYESDWTRAFAGATGIMAGTFPGGIFKELPGILFNIALV